jgi:hypothetical protein
MSAPCTAPQRCQTCHSNILKSLYCRTLQCRQAISAPFVGQTYTTNINYVESYARVTHQPQVVCLGTGPRNVRLQPHAPCPSWDTRAGTWLSQHAPKLGTARQRWLVRRPCAQVVPMPHSVDVGNAKDPNLRHHPMVPHERRHSFCHLQRSHTSRDPRHCSCLAKSNSELLVSPPHTQSCRGLTNPHGTSNQHHSNSLGQLFTIRYTKQPLH